MTADRPPGAGHPLRGLRWGLLVGVVAALALFAVVLVVETGGPADGPRAGDGYTTEAPGPEPSGGGSPTASASGTPAASETPSGGGAGGVGPARTGSAPPRPPTATGAVLSRGALAPGWETDGWSWDSTVAAGATGPDGRPAYSVTYKAPFAGFALRSRVTGRPAGTAVLQVRVYVAGPAVRLGLQVQSADDGGLGPVVRREAPSRRWVTLAAPVSELRPPAGVRRISVIAQGVPAGTRVFVSEVALR